MRIKILFLSLLVLAIGFACKPKAPAPSEEPETAVQFPDYQRMILAYVYIKPEYVSDFIEAAQSIIEDSNREEGCLEYMLYHNPYDETKFIFVERYANRAAVDTHFAASYFNDFGPKIEHMTMKPAEIKVFSIAGED